MPKGVYERTTRNHYQRMSPELGRRIKDEYEAGASVNKLADKHGVAKSTVTRAIRNNGGRIREFHERKPERGLLGWLHNG